MKKRKRTMIKVIRRTDKKTMTMPLNLTEKEIEHMTEIQILNAPLPAGELIKCCTGVYCDVTGAIYDTA